MIILMTLLWILSLDTSQCVSFRYTKVSCLETYKLGRRNQDKITCTGEHVVNHCIPDDQQKEGEVCVQWKWITPGYCPYYDKSSDVIKEKHCSFYCLWKDDEQDICTCPSTFNNDSCNNKCTTHFGSDIYIFCEYEMVSTSTSPTKNVTSGRHDIRKSSKSHFNISSTTNTTFGRHDIRKSSESQVNFSALGIALGVILPLILLVVVGILLFKRRRDKQGTRKEELSVDIGEGEALLSTGTNCQEENEQNNQQQKRTSKEKPSVESGEGDTLLSMGTKYQEENERNDRQQTGYTSVLYERTATEAMESSPLLAGNTNENQSEEDSLKNGDTSEVNKLDSSQKIDSYLTPPTSLTTALATAQDIQTEDVGNEEDTSNETERKEAVGIFVSSLESIMKEDDEEGGTSELQGLLDHMCTGPARKILFIVVKEYVDNIDSYFQDESKKASVRMVLPPEDHSALNTKSDLRNSIPVMYAILQSSLHAEHQPKSGWGQEVKDPDTGVGDDVERVYKVHMLNREIQYSEKISVDGYVRLFEMLIGTVERLDVKGKCSEDYREIVRRWENIQRKLSVKDKWYTFTNFIKKWSE